MSLNDFGRYRPIIRYFHPLGIERVSIADDEALHHILVKNSYDYSQTKFARIWFRKVLGEGLVVAEGDAHMHRRKMLSPRFSMSSANTLSSIFWC